MSTIYLDHNATTPLHPEVLEAMMPFLSNDFGNASSLHQYGQRARKAIEDARQKLAAFINAADPNEIVFTSGGTESNNMAIKGTLEASKGKGQRMVSTSIEHNAVQHVLENLAEEGKIKTHLLSAHRTGVVTADELIPVLTSDTILVTVMAVNNETGTIQPIQEIAALCREKGVPIHTDAVQAAGKIKIDVRAWGVDLLSLSGHKLGAPKGTGLLYIKKGTRLAALIDGGSQEKNRRGGTENVAGIVGLGKAADVTIRDFPSETGRIKTMRDKLETEVLKNIPATFVNGDKDQRVSNTTNICFDCTDSSGMVMALDLKGLACSNGSACASGSPTPSHVLTAMGLPQAQAHASLRISLGWTTKEEDIEKAISILKETTARMRESNPLWKYV